MLVGTSAGSRLGSDDDGDDQIRDEEDANDGDSCMRRAMRSRSWSADARLRNGKEARKERDTVSCMHADSLQRVHGERGVYERSEPMARGG